MNTRLQPRPRATIRPRLALAGLLGSVVLAGVALIWTLPAQPSQRAVAAVSPINPSPAANPSPVCRGKTKVESGGLSPMPRLLCEVAPGKWVEIDPRNPPPSSAPPGAKKCPGKQKTVFTPGMPMPELLCETSPGKWEPDPTSPYAESIKNQKPGSCGPFDVACMAKGAVNGWFQDLVTSAAKPVFRFLGSTVLGTPSIGSDTMARARALWGTSQIIANTSFVLVVSVAGVLLMAGQSVPGELSAKELLPRVVLAFGASNLSLLFLGYGIDFANGLAHAFLDSGAGKIDASVVADLLGGSILANIPTGGTFFVMAAVVVVVLAVCVAFIYVVRLAITMVLIAAAPLALMFHALPMTDGLARLWWRGISGILAIQVCQSLVLVTAFQLMLTETKDSQGSFAGIPTKGDLIDLLLAICLLWVLIRIPSWVARTIWRNAQPRMLGRLVKSFIIYRGVGSLVSKVSGSGRRPGGGKRPNNGPGGPGPRHPGPPPRPHNPKPQPTPLPDPVYRVPRPPAPPPPPKPRRQAHAAPQGWKRPTEARASGRPTQLTLPIPVRSKPGTTRPVQTALPISVTRVPRPPATPPPASSSRPRVRSRQQMLPGMPRRPVPPRQLTLRLDPPKQNQRRGK